MDDSPLIDLATRPRSGWSQWFGIGGKPTAQQHEFYLPGTMLPSDTFTIINEYSNMAVFVDAIMTPTIVMSALPMVATMVMMGAFNMPAALEVKLSRNKSYSVVSGNVPTILGGSPRFGISLGNVFKHKAYVALNAGAWGFAGVFYRIIWLQTYGVGFPELVHNSRLTRFYVKHGKVTNTYSVDTNLYVQLYNPDATFSCDVAVEGTITFYGMRTNGLASKSFSFSSINASWHAKLSPATTSEGEENSFVPTIGDFYVLDKAILCDDPQTMYELGLDVYDGFYGTQEQRYKFITHVIGIWIYDEEEMKWEAYVDRENADLVSLPGNETQQEIANEKGELGGDYATGISKWQSNSSETIRLIISAKADNLCSSNLIGEYFQLSGGDYYEIIDHPRSDTIEIKNKSVSSGSLLFQKNAENSEAEDNNDGGGDSGPGEIILYQQKFWKIVEMYTDASTGGRGGLWEGMIDSVSEGTDGFYEIRWSTKEDNNSRAAITPSQTFPQRFRATADTSQLDADIGYKKYAGWNLIVAGDMFPVKKATFTSDNGIMTVGMTVFGKPPENMWAIVSMGEPYSNPYTQLGYHNFAAIMRVSMAQETNSSGIRAVGQNALFMEGYYDVGYYKLPMPLSVKERLAITSFMYGAETSEYPHVPRVWVATRQPSTSGVCCLEYGTSQKQCVIFSDPDTEMMAFIKADAGWIEGRQKGAIRCGMSTTIDASDADDAGEYYALTGMRSKITASAKGSKELKGFFVYAPSRESVSDYYAVSIGGQGGIKTPLTMKTGAKIDSTSVSNILLPLEAYEPTPGSSSDIYVGTPLALKTKSVNLSLCGFDEVKDDKRFVSLQSQGLLPAITPSSIATKFELSKGRQVITNAKQFNAHTCSDGSVIMFYSAETDVFTVGDSEQKNPSKSSVFVIKSNTNMDQWGSPKFDRLTLSQKTGNQDQLDEWERPLMIAYDFEFASSIMLSENRFLIFGYGYARDNNDDTSSKTTTQHLFLGCYQISLVGLRCGDTHACYLSKAKNEDEDISVRFYFRPNHAQTSDSNVYSMKFGQAIKGVPSATEEDKYADSCTERFVRIMGGSKSGVAESMEMDGFAQDVISPTLSSDGTQFVYFGDYASGTIKRVLSCSGGLTWKQDENADSLATGTCPTAFGDKLFYFDGTSLYCRKLSSDLSPRVVASDVVGHKIAVNTDAQGRTFVFYLNGSGYVRSSVSMDNGLRWESSTNW